MVFLQFSGAVVSFLFALAVMAVAKGGVHEATAAVFFCTGAVMFAGASITMAINKIRTTIVELLSKSDNNEPGEQ